MALGFDWILGIDQTGRVYKNKPGPLPFALLQRQSSGWRLMDLPNDFKRGLPSLHRDSIQKLIGSKESQKILVAVDAVLGLARECGISQSSLAHKFEQARQSYVYGKQAGEIHFAKYWKDLKLSLPPQRRCEQKARANSVFTTKPAQKNIQTGTHRLWMDLGEETSWFDLWPSAKLTRSVIIAEVYPSFFWREFFGFQKREPARIEELFSKLSIAFSRSSLTRYQQADWADAAVSALGALRVLLDQRLLWEGPRHDSTACYEGWILGLPL